MRDYARATHSQSLSSCQVCSKTFQTKSNLNRHMKLHAGYFTKCDKCSKVLKRPKDHPTKCIIPKDQRERKFECIICRRKFLNKRYLKEHLKYKHGPKQYKCQKCEKNSHTGRLLMITKKIVPTNFRTGHRDAIGYQPLSLFSVFKVIVLFLRFFFVYVHLIILFIFILHVYLKIISKSYDIKKHLL